jgi:hypothetical protein
MELFQSVEGVLKDGARIGIDQPYLSERVCVFLLMAAQETQRLGSQVQSNLFKRDVRKTYEQSSLEQNPS